MFLTLLRRHEGWVSVLLVAALIIVGFAGIQTLFAAKPPPPATPVLVAQGQTPTQGISPTQGTAQPSTATVTVTSSSTPVTAPATPTLLPTATVSPVAPPSTATETATAVPPPLPTPLPTATPLPAANQPPQIQAALMPLDIDDDRKAGVFTIQVAATDPEGSSTNVVTILRLPPSEHERTVKLKTARKLAIKFTQKELEIRAPDPQTIIDQITAYGGIVVESGQQIDLRVKKPKEGKLQWEDDKWRLEAPTIDLVVVATDADGVSSSTQVNSCLAQDCPAYPGE